MRSFYAILVASSVSFGIYFAIAGTVFLGMYQVPQYTYEDWHLFAAQLGFGCRHRELVALGSGHGPTRPNSRQARSFATVFDLLAVSLCAI